MLWIRRAISHSSSRSFQACCIRRPLRTEVKIGSFETPVHARTESALNEIKSINDREEANGSLNIQIAIINNLLESGSIERAARILTKLPNDHFLVPQLTEKLVSITFSKLRKDDVSGNRIMEIIKQLRGFMPKGALPRSVMGKILSLLLKMEYSSPRIKEETITKVFYGYRSKIQTVSDFMRKNEVKELAKILKVKYNNEGIPNTERAESETKVEQEDTSSVTLGDLTEYISKERFTGFDKDGEPLPYFVLYDTLNEKDKILFEERYTKFSIKRQLTTETMSNELYMTTLMKNLGSRSASSSMLFNQNSNLFYDWHRALTNSIEELLKEEIPMPVKSNDVSILESELYRWQECLKLVPASEIAAITIHESSKLIIGSNSDGYSVVSHIVKSLGQKFNKLLAHHTKKNIPHIESSHFLPLKDRYRVGGILLALLVQKCEFNKNDEMAPAFIHAFMRAPKSVHKIGIIKPDPDLSIHLSKSFSSAPGAFSSPMLVKPKPWKTPTEGGYLTDTQSMLLSTTSKKERILYFQKAHKLNQLDNIYRSLDVLGSTAWCVNGKSLKVLLHYFRKGESFLKLPPKISEKDLQLKPKPENCDNKQEYAIWFKRAREERQQYFGKISDRIAMENVFSLCEAYSKNGEKMYFPYGVDFRGRLYPLTATLHHALGDPIRGMLQFWYGKPLGARGLGWLKAHLASVYGEDKLSREEKIKFIDNNLENIRDSAENPINGEGWWKTAEKPWQTLSTCFELTEALKLKDPSVFISRIPIQQDGSCNGLQHYAALGGDIKGGKEVNLLPSSTKQDVYTTILKLVKEIVDKDALDETSKNHISAKYVLPHLVRKTLKQTVMTSVYGVTLYGAVAQIQNRIKETIESKTHSNKLTEEEIEFFDADNIHTISSYLAMLTLSSIKDLFYDAKRIEDWLVHNTTRVTTSFNFTQFKEAPVNKKGESQFEFGGFGTQVMAWTSLLGIPVVQLYRNAKLYTIQTPLQSVSIPHPHSIEKISARKQVNAVAPNFIHSIDATHLSLTAVNCNYQGIEFASVHDSFWTHACDVDLMSKILRQEFINLHSIDIIKGLKDDLQVRMKDNYQLVYLENGSKSTTEILELRKGYHSTVATKVLGHELETIHNKNGITPYDIVLKNGDILYYKVGKKYIKYDNNCESVTNEEDVRCKVSLIVPVKILDEPSAGDLDITQVKDSEFFFS